MWPFVRMVVPAPVAVITMSLAPSTASISSHGAALCAADRLGGARRVRHRPADDRHLLHALRLHVPGRQLAHFAGADDEDGPPLEVAEDLARERDRRKADRDGARGEPGLRADALAGGERRVKQPVEHGADRLRAGGEGVGFFHLAEDLRLADDQRIEAGGHAEQMTGGVEIDQVVNMRGELAAIDAVKLADEGAEIGARRPDVFARRIDFGAIAGGEHDRLVGRAPGGQRPQRRLHASLEVDPLTQVDGRGAVTEAHNDYVHTRCGI